MDGIAGAPGYRQGIGDKFAWDVLPLPKGPKGRGSTLSGDGWWIKKDTKVAAGGLGAPEADGGARSTSGPSLQAARSTPRSSSLVPDYFRLTSVKNQDAVVTTAEQTGIPFPVTPSFASWTGEILAPALADMWNNKKPPRRPCPASPPRSTPSWPRTPGRPGCELRRSTSGGADEGAGPASDDAVQTSASSAAAAGAWGRRAAARATGRGCCWSRRGPGWAGTSTWAGVNNWEPVAGPTGLAQGAVRPPAAPAPGASPCSAAPAPAHPPRAAGTRCRPETDYRLSLSRRRGLPIAFEPAGAGRGDGGPAGRAGPAAPSGAARRFVDLQRDGAPDHRPLRPAPPGAGVGAAPPPSSTPPRTSIWPALPAAPPAWARSRAARTASRAAPEQPLAPPQQRQPVLPRSAPGARRGPRADTGPSGGGRPGGDPHRHQHPHLPQRRPEPQPGGTDAGLGGVRAAPPGRAGGGVPGSQRRRVLAHWHLLQTRHGMEGWKLYLDQPHAGGAGDAPPGGPLRPARRRLPGRPGGPGSRRNGGRGGHRRPRPGLPRGRAGGRAASWTGRTGSPSAASWRWSWTTSWWPAAGPASPPWPRRAAG